MIHIALQNTFFCFSDRWQDKWLSIIVTIGTYTKINLFFSWIVLERRKEVRNVKW
jgi:hypothetical protein